MKDLETVQQSYERLVNSGEFKHQGFLCGFFLMSEIEKIEDAMWQIDFYDKDSAKITSYLMESKIKVNENSEAFKKPETKIESLEIKDIKISFEEACRKSQKVLKLKMEEPTKIIATLQKQNKPAWNISFITQKFNIQNVRINAVSGRIIEEKLISLLSFKEN